MIEAGSLPTPPPLAPTLPECGDDPRAALVRIAKEGFRFVQFNAVQPGLRPRELDRSARRGLLATLRRLELRPSGVDLWIPPAHFIEADRVDRAVHAVMAAIDFAADLERTPLCLSLPSEGLHPDVLESMIAAAERNGIELADHARPIRDDVRVGIGIDPAQILSNSGDPAKDVLNAGGRLVSARLCDLLSTGMRGPIGGKHSQGGRLDVLSYRMALEASGYDRPVILDARQWPEPWTGMMQSVDGWSCPL